MVRIEHPRHSHNNSILCTEMMKQDCLKIATLGVEKAICVGHFEMMYVLEGLLAYILAG